MKGFGSVALMFGLFTASFAEAGVFEDATDRFTGVRSVAWNTIPTEPETFAVATSAYYSKGSPAPNEYLVQIITYSDSAQFDRCPYVDWLVDGEPLADLRTTYSHDSGGLATIERFVLKPDRAMLAKLTAAKLVEFKVCNVESSISRDDIDGMRKVLENTQ